MNRKAYFFTLWLCIQSCTASAHENVVHRRIATHASESALDSSAAYRGFVGTVAMDCVYDDVVKWLVNGSDFEDNINDEGGSRPVNHFYDPLSGRGLDNIFPDDRAGLIGNDSFTWAVTLNCPGVDASILGLKCLSNEGTINKWSWRNARDYEWHGLTEADRGDRYIALTNMFRSVGQVMHLLQDTSQPQHSRNEQHVYPIPCIKIPSPWRSQLEKYGQTNSETLNYQHAVLDWRGAGFTKLEDFWNRHLYNGQASILRADANGGTKLGLAEFSNGNFLGERHLYREYFVPGKVGYYPFPSRDESTNYKQVKADPRSGLDTFTLKNGSEVQGVYIAKTSDGIPVSHHSRMNYLGAKKISGLTGKPFCTIRDEKVLEDYHSELIPKAVEYSAGLLDYFFRGRLDTTIAPNTGSGGTLLLTITNISHQPLTGGAFHLFYDTAGTRIELTSTGNGFVTTWNSSSGPLAHNDTIVASFTPPSGVTVSKYILVYKGTIGASSGSQHDEVDDDIAIAAKTFIPFLYWTMDETSGNRVDSIRGFTLTPESFGGTFSSISAIGNAIRMASSGGTMRLRNTSTGLLFTDGMSMCGWFRYASQTRFSVGLRVVPTIGFSANEAGSMLLFYGSTSGANFSSPPSAGQWHFYILELTPSGDLRVEFDRNGDVHTLAAFVPSSELHLPTFVVTANSSSAGTLDVDETALFPFMLTTDQKNFLWNSGNGRTYPFSMP